MKIQMFNIDFSDFTEGKEIEKIEFYDYSLHDMPIAYLITYWTNIKSLIIYKTTTSSAENTIPILGKYVEYSIFHPLN
jgi:hypothetical protein